MRSPSGILLLVALLAAIGWLVFSIHGLVHSATDYHVRVLDPVRLGTTRPTTAEASTMEAEQIRWGESTMFAVAGVAMFFVLSLVNAVFHARQRARQNESRR